MTTANILEGIAVARRSADDAATIFGAYATTQGLQMAQSYSAEPDAPAPSAPASSPTTPGGTQAKQAQPQKPGGGATKNAALVAEHEVFRNNRNAVAFFFYHQLSLDANPEEGPFWFKIQDDKRIIAGTSKAYAILEGLEPDVVAMAKQRGVIMLVEFENQQPYRVTPCYLSDSF